MEDQLADFRQLLGKVYDLRAAAQLLGWDQQTYMPPGGGPARAQQIATLEQLSHERFVSDEFGAALSAAQHAVADLDPDSDDACLVREVTRLHDRSVRVSSEWVGEFNHQTGLAFEAWVKAKPAADFNSFIPHLKQIVVLRRQYAEFFAPYEHVYDPLIAEFEPGIKTLEVKAIFDDLRPTQVALLREIVERGSDVNDDFLHIDYDDHQQRRFGEEVIRQIGYDFDRGRQDSAAHPFTTEFGINDVRITTRIKTDYMPTGLFSTMHEAGHALYAQGVKQSLDRTPLINGASLGFHESQSRMIENLVGRSLPFWRAYYPQLQQTFPSQLGSVKLQDFYRAINKVKPSLIRTEADEATYNLHVMLRFDLEISMMRGELEVADLPEAWSAKMQEYLGLDVPDHTRGVLQDVHWSGGSIGYFPTYALGNLIAAQLWETIQSAIPDLEQQIANKDFSTLLAWLRENVHQHGGKFKPSDLLQRITGQSLTAEPYTAYLRRKYAEIYQL